MANGRLRAAVSKAERQAAGIIGTARLRRATTIIAAISSVQGFDWTTLWFSDIDDPAKLKEAVAALFAEVIKEAKILSADPK